MMLKRDAGTGCEHRRAHRGAVKDIKLLVHVADENGAGLAVPDGAEVGDVSDEAAGAVLDTHVHTMETRVHTRQTPGCAHTHTHTHTHTHARTHTHLPVLLLCLACVTSCACPVPGRQNLNRLSLHVVTIARAPAPPLAGPKYALVTARVC